MLNYFSRSSASIVLLNGAGQMRRVGSLFLLYFFYMIFESSVKSFSRSSASIVLLNGAGQMRRVGSRGKLSTFVGAGLKARAHYKLMQCTDTKFVKQFIRK